jgi:Protein of unknown function (DUF3072)
MSTSPDEYDVTCPGDSGHVPRAEPYVPDYDDRPSAKQLSYLRTLADRTGQTFAYPHTCAQASAEIRRLKAATPSTRLERALERREISDAIARGPENAASVDLDRDVGGYGSTATWR